MATEEVLVSFDDSTSFFDHPSTSNSSFIVVYLGLQPEFKHPSFFASIQSSLIRVVIFEIDFKIGHNNNSETRY